MHIRVMQIYHRHYPEIRGEGRSLGEAARHLARRLTRHLDRAHGRKRRALERAIAAVRARYPASTQPPRGTVAVIA
jgi:hypothetical protein